MSYTMCAETVNIFISLFASDCVFNAFSVIALLVGRQEDRVTCKRSVYFWRPA